MGLFGKRKKAPKKPKAVDRSKFAKQMVQRWDNTKFFQRASKKKL